MSKLLATDGAVRVKIAKHEVINQGGQGLLSAWNVMLLQKHKQYPDSVIRDVELSSTGEDVIITAYMGKIEESDDE